MTSDEIALHQESCAPITSITPGFTARVRHFPHLVHSTHPRASTSGTSAADPPSMASCTVVGVSPLSVATVLRRPAPQAQPPPIEQIVFMFHREYSPDVVKSQLRTGTRLDTNYDMAVTRAAQRTDDSVGLLGQYLRGFPAKHASQSADVVHSTGTSGNDLSRMVPQGMEAQVRTIPDAQDVDPTVVRPKRRWASSPRILTSLTTERACTSRCSSPQTLTGCRKLSHGASRCRPMLRRRCSSSSSIRIPLNPSELWLL